MSNIERVHSSMYDIFGKEFEDISTDSLQYLEYYDLDLNGPNAVSDFRLEVKDIENFFLLHKAYVECRFHITTGAGGNLVAENVALQNNAVGIFRRWELLFDDVVVEAVDDAGVCNTIQNLVYFSNNYSNSIAGTQLWYPDTTNAATINYTVPGGGSNVVQDLADTVNLGHKRRQQICGLSRQVTVHIPLNNVFGFVKGYDKLIRGIKITLRLTRESDANALISVGANDFKLVMDWASLWIPKVKPNVSVLPSITSKLTNSGVHFIPFTDTQIFRSGLQAQATNNAIFQVKTKRKRPIKVFIAFQKVDRVTGDQLNIKRIFDHVQLKKLRVVLNANDQYPEREYITSFLDAANSTGHDYARVYGELMRAGLRDHDIHDGSIVTFDSFRTLFPIFCIDMSNQPEYQVAPNSALIDVYWTAAGVNYYMWVVVEAERKMEIAASSGKMKFVNTV